MLLPVRTQELKCGSSFYVESLAPVHLSVSKASRVKTLSCEAMVFFAYDE